MNIDAKVEEIFAPISERLAEIVFYSVSLGEGIDVKLILVWLVLAALFFTFYFGFINVRGFKHALDLVFGKNPNGESDGNKDGQINRFQALMTSLSGTVGLGNIAGVAVAVSAGGPGAAFWMFVMGFFSMSTKFAEVALGVKYRRHTDPEHPDKISGGPMYYLRDGLAGKRMPLLGKILAGIFACAVFLGVLGGGSLFQTNQVYKQLLNVTGGDASFFADKGWLVGLLMVFAVGLVIIGGIKSIAATASRIVPLMALIYLVAGFVVIAIHYAQIPMAMLSIFESALSLKAGFGAALGALLMGVQRAAFSNEAGLGTAAIAHASAKTDEPVSQGIVGMLGPFIDTMVICMLTALVIIISGTHLDGNGIEGVELTSRAFASGLSWFPYVLFLVVFMFAYSSLISWFYYGVKGFTYLFGSSDVTENVYKLIFSVFIVIGASANLSSVILITDSLVFIMAIPNIIALYILAPELKQDLKAYIQKIKAA
ncbi:MAG: amino acid carrier protein [Alphaproteobacteria bacterium]